MTDWRPGASRAALRARAELLATLRRFFAERGVMEVCTPILASYGVSDPAIEVFEIRSGVAVAGQPRYLQSSPEYAMKRLLADGAGAIYQLGPVFRDGEIGRRHNPEFTMLEWYRPDFSLDDLIQEVGELARICLGRESWSVRTYGELFDDLLALDAHAATVETLEACARERLELGALRLDRDGWLDLLMSHCIEPQIATRGMVFVHDYPASQAALARRVSRDQQMVADRFELYVDGVEVANGYRELLDADELRARAEEDNRRRAAIGAPQRALDQRLVAALEAGMPDCSGVALGVDRLLMLMRDTQDLADVVAFDWSRS